MTEPTRRGRHPLALAISMLLAELAILGFFWWLGLPIVFDSPGARVSVTSGSGDWAVTFLVQDASGRPVPGVSVGIASYSGRVQDAITDDAGRAVVMPSESEVTAVGVDGLIVRFERGRLHDEFFLPDCGDGLMVNVKLSPSNPIACAHQAEYKAVKFVKKLGGEIERDNKSNGKPVIRVTFRRSGEGELIDAGLKELAGFKQLQALDLSSTNVTGAGLKELKNLTNLTELDLRETQGTCLPSRGLL